MVNPAVVPPVSIYPTGSAAGLHGAALIAALRGAIGAEQVARAAELVALAQVDTMRRDALRIFGFGALCGVLTTCAIRLALWGVSWA